ncbi:MULTISPECIES: LytR C-terminal domain-containing protein [unclassified Luteococcus]|uniref:LytR C-terminal domain-containing protein n=1 Tax=unclassified Luteococcus TaxID=2639923 RepID=UPI00313DC466
MQRYVRLFGTPITLLVLLGILVFGARWGWKNVIAPAPPAPLIPCTEQNVGKALTAQHVSVKVFNGGSRSGLASTVGTQLKGVGFKVVKTGNTDVEVSAPQIIGAAVDNPEVKLVAGFFPGAQIKADGRADHTVEVLVGNQKTNFNPKAPASIAVTTPTVCLPAPIATPTP